MLWHCGHVDLSVMLQKNYVIDYQACQPFKEKLRDQPNKIIVFAEITVGKIFLI